MMSSALTTYGSSPTHQSWDSALNDILSVLRIQYKNDDDVMIFLTDPDKLKQLQYSTAAKMEWNRRVIKEEMDSGIHSPPRSRRIAKEVAIDYIRRYLDGEEERVEMMRKIQMLQNDKEDALSSLVDTENDLKKSKEENLRISVDNNNLREEIEKFRTDNSLARSDNKELRVELQSIKEESDVVRGENSSLREENAKIRCENDEIRGENTSLRSDNQKTRADNSELRDEAGKLREENLKLRKENQTIRDENEQVRAENAAMREENGRLREKNGDLRASNGTLSGENKELSRDNVKLHGQLNEMRVLVNLQQDVLQEEGNEEKEEEGDDHV